MTTEERQDGERRRRHSKPDADKAAAGWGSALVAGFIAAAVIGNVLSLRRRLANVHKASTQLTTYVPTCAGGRATGQGVVHIRGKVQTLKDVVLAPSSIGNQNNSKHGRTLSRMKRNPNVCGRSTWKKWYERIRRRQEAFDRERMRTKRNYESWQERHGDKWEWKWHGSKWEWEGEAERRRAAEGRNDWWRDAQVM